MNQEDAINEYLAQPTHWLPKYEYKDEQLTISGYNHGPIITATVAV
jgi:hypothetical protein